MSEDNTYTVPKIGFETFYATMQDDGKASYLVTTIGDRQLYDCINPAFAASLANLNISSLFQPLSISVCMMHRDGEHVDGRETKRALRAITTFTYYMMASRACNVYKTLVEASGDSDGSVDAIMMDAGIYDEIDEYAREYDRQIETCAQFIPRGNEFAAFIESCDVNDPVEIISSFNDEELHAKMLSHMRPTFSLPPDLEAEDMGSLVFEPGSDVWGRNAGHPAASANRHKDEYPDAYDTSITTTSFERTGDGVQLEVDFTKRKYAFIDPAIAEVMDSSGINAEQMMLPRKIRVSAKMDKTNGSKRILHKMAEYAFHAMELSSISRYRLVLELLRKKEEQRNLAFLLVSALSMFKDRCEKKLEELEKDIPLDIGFNVQIRTASENSEWETVYYLPHLVANTLRMNDMIPYVKVANANQSFQDRSALENCDVNSVNARLEPDETIESVFDVEDALMKPSRRLSSGLGECKEQKLALKALEESAAASVHDVAEEYVAHANETLYCDASNRKCFLVAEFDDKWFDFVPAAVRNNMNRCAFAYNLLHLPQKVIVESKEQAEADASIAAMRETAIRALSGARFKAAYIMLAAFCKMIESQVREDGVIEALLRVEHIVKESDELFSRPAEHGFLVLRRGYPGIAFGTIVDGCMEQDGGTVEQAMEMFKTVNPSFDSVCSDEHGAGLLALETRILTARERLVRDMARELAATMTIRRNTGTMEVNAGELVLPMENGSVLREFEDNVRSDAGFNVKDGIGYYLLDVSPNVAGCVDKGFARGLLGSSFLEDMLLPPSIICKIDVSASGGDDIAKRDADNICKTLFYNELESIASLYGDALLEAGTRLRDGGEDSSEIDKLLARCREYESTCNESAMEFAKNVSEDVSFVAVAKKSNGMYTIVSNNTDEYEADASIDSRVFDDLMEQYARSLGKRATSPRN